jgi:uncharacterized protein
MKRDCLVLIVAMTFPSVMAWLYFVELTVEGGRPNEALLFAFSIGKFVQFTFPAAYVWCLERERLRPTPPTRNGLVLSLGFGFATGAAILGLYFGWLKDSPLLADTPAKIYQKVQEFGMATPGRFLLLAGFISIVHSLLEEYYWRWFVFGWLRKYLALWPAIALSSAAFMAHHVIVLGVYFPEQFWNLAVPFSLGVALGGGIWAWIYERSQSLWATWLSHLVIDAAIMAVGFDMISRYWS